MDVPLGPVSEPKQVDTSTPSEIKVNKEADFLKKPFYQQRQTVSTAVNKTLGVNLRMSRGWYKFVQFSVFSTNNLPSKYSDLTAPSTQK